jgi:hypothetical protein
MTGLEDTDVIIEIAVIITNGQLEPVDAGIDYVIRTPKEVLDAYVLSVLIPPSLWQMRVQLDWRPASRPHVLSGRDPAVLNPVDAE